MAHQFLEIVKDSPFTAICKPTHPELILSTPSSVMLSHSGPESTCPHHPRTRCQASRDSPMASEPLELSMLAHPKPASLWKPPEDSCPWFSLIPSAAWLTLVLPVWPCRTCPLLLETSCDKLSLSLFFFLIWLPWVSVAAHRI